MNQVAVMLLWALAPAAWAQPATQTIGGDVKRGQLLFLQCAACHSPTANPQGKIGPALTGVLQRRAGTLDGFAYSKSMAASGLAWDGATLDRFLGNPSATVPDTKMLFGGVPSARDRADVIAYLERL